MRRRRAELSPPSRRGARTRRALSQFQIHTGRVRPGSIPEIPDDRRLPRHDFPAANRLPHARRPAEEGAGNPEALGRRGPVRPAAPDQRRPGKVHPARRAALRQRQHPYRHRPQQDPQRPDQPDPANAGQGCELRPGLGLPRPADRMEDRGAVPREGPGPRAPSRSTISGANAASSPNTGSRFSARSSSASA